MSSPVLPPYTGYSDRFPQAGLCYPGMPPPLPGLFFCAVICQSCVSDLCTDSPSADPTVRMARSPSPQSSPTRGEEAETYCRYRAPPHLWGRGWGEGAGWSSRRTCRSASAFLHHRLPTTAAKPPPAHDRCTSAKPCRPRATLLRRSAVRCHNC